jgi:hypothetical protein
LLLGFKDQKVVPIGLFSKHEQYYHYQVVITLDEDQ